MTISYSIGGKKVSPQDINKIVLNNETIRKICSAIRTRYAGGGTLEN